VAVNSVRRIGTSTFVIGGHPKILIVRLSAIGDVVRVLPAATAVRQAYPSAQIDWVVESAAADILQNNPDLDRILVFDRGPRLVKSFLLFAGLLARVHEQRYDIAIDFHGVLKSGLLLFATRADQRISFSRPRAREGSHWFANDRVMLSAPVMNRVDENLELVSNSTLNASPTISTIHIDKQINTKVFRTITERKKNHPWLVLIHAPVDRPEKWWPDERFAALIDLFLGDGRFDVILTHGPGQRAMLDPILDCCKHDPIVPPPCVSLREYAGLVSKVSLYVGVDTGPMHIAAAVGTPVVAIFGGTSPQMHSPVGAPLRVFGGVRVSESTERATEVEARRALEGVLPSDVFSAAVDLLEENS